MKQLQYHQKQNERAKQTKNNIQYSAVAVAVAVAVAAAGGEVINIIGITFFRFDTTRHTKSSVS